METTRTTTSERQGSEDDLLIVVVNLRPDRAEEDEPPRSGLLHATYRGTDDRLSGRRALLLAKEDDASVVLAQFDDFCLVPPPEPELAIGWHEFPAACFSIDEARPA